MIEQISTLACCKAASTPAVALLSKSVSTAHDIKLVLEEKYNSLVGDIDVRKGRGGREIRVSLQYIEFDFVQCYTRSVYKESEVV